MLLVAPGVSAADHRVRHLPLQEVVGFPLWPILSNVFDGRFFKVAMIKSWVGFEVSEECWPPWHFSVNNYSPPLPSLPPSLPSPSLWILVATPCKRCCPAQPHLPLNHFQMSGNASSGTEWFLEKLQLFHRPIPDIWMRTSAAHTTSIGWKSNIRSIARVRNWL